MASKHPCIPVVGPPSLSCMHTCLRGGHILQLPAQMFLTGAPHSIILNMTFVQKYTRGHSTADFFLPETDWLVVHMIELVATPSRRGLTEGPSDIDFYSEIG